MSSSVQYDVPNDVYRASKGVSHSELKVLRMQSPWHLMMQRLRPPTEPKRPKPQLITGSALHCAVLEPHAFIDRYCDDSPLNKNSKDYKLLAAEWAAAGLTPLDEEQRTAVRGMRDSLLAHPTIGPMLERAGHAEVSAWWTDETTGTLCKGRADKLIEYEPKHGPSCALIDLKSTSDASPDAFARSIHTFGYHTQCDWYVRGFELATQRQCDGMLFVVVESEYPFACACYALNDATLNEAAQLNRRALDTYAECLRTQHWPGYERDADDNGITTIGIPHWAFTKD